jgi:hypothetical protein
MRIYYPQAISPVKLQDAGGNTFVASSIPVSTSTNLKSSGLTSSPIEISRQSRPANAGFILCGAGGLSIKLCIAACVSEGWRLARGDPGAARRDSLKLCRCWWFEAWDNRGVRPPIEGGRESTLDRGDAVFEPFELSGTSSDCSAMVESLIAGRLAPPLFEYTQVTGRTAEKGDAFGQINELQYRE